MFTMPCVRLWLIASVLLPPTVGQAEAPAATAPAPAKAVALEAAPAELEAQVSRAKARVGKVYGKSIALVIGISKYAHMTPLTGAVRDAKAMGEVLTDHGFEVTLLLDEEATASQIKRLLTAGRVEDIGETDRVFIYFAGHGVSVGEDHRAMGYLMPVDAREDLAAADGIDMEWLQRIFRIQYRAKHVMFVADACYSGLAISTRGASPRAKNPGVLARLTDKPVRLALTAGSAGQQAHEEGGHGLFTYKLLNALRGAADSGNRDGVVTSAELWAYVQTEVTQTAARKGYEQTPQFGREGEGEMLFANLSGLVGVTPFSSNTTATATVGPMAGQGHLLAWTALGTGLLVGGLGGWALSDGFASWDQGADVYAQWDRSGGTTDAVGGELARDEARRDVERLDAEGTQKANLGRVLLGVGGALVVTGGLLFLFDGDGADSSQTALGVGLTPNKTGGLGLYGRW